MGKPHVLAIPYPAQGHVIPLMELMQCLAKQGFRITFVNTDFNHKRVINALSEEDNAGEIIHLVSIPDGLDPSEDRKELGILSEAIFRVMPEKLQELIEKTNAADDMTITCIIADAGMGWAVEVARKMGIKRAVFCPASASVYATCFSVPKLIDDGIINNNGTPIKNQMIQLSPTMPPMNTAQFGWACIGDLTTQKQIFDLTVKCNEFITLADWIVSSSAYELESAAFTLFPNILPIGPLLASNRLGKQSGYFWPEDTTCLSWLDQQPPCSVIYVAFGSFTVFYQTQFQELALGLELTKRPFLWVVRPDITVELDDSYPEGFEDRVSIRGRMVGWAPQQKVLSHPSVACFLSHCGWNSTMEGVGNGVPFLCWPYFADQFHNQSYICDVWNVGLGLDKDKRGIITRGEINNKVEQLLDDKTFKARALHLKEKVLNNVREGGRSHKNFSNFIEWMK